MRRTRTSLGQTIEDRGNLGKPSQGIRPGPGFRRTMGLSGPSLFGRGRCSSFRRGRWPCCRSWSLPLPAGRPGQARGRTHGRFTAAGQRRCNAQPIAADPRGRGAGPGWGCAEPVSCFSGVRPRRRPPPPPVEAPLPSPGKMVRWANRCGWRKGSALHVPCRDRPEGFPDSALAPGQDSGRDLRGV